MSDFPLSTSAKGALACAAFDKRALEKGGIVSVSLVETRYDRLLDLDGRLYRVQVKYSSRTSSHAEGSVIVHLASYAGGAVTAPSYDPADVDAVVVYLPALDALFWLDPQDFEGRSSVTLRLAPPKNGQRAGVRLASDYLW